MDIREAIIHARQVAEGCGVDSRDCAYQHDKLADWMEELQAYRAKIPFARLDEAAALVKDWDEGRVHIDPPPAKEGDPQPDCFEDYGGSLWCLGYQRSENVDEPCDRCKRCWYCKNGDYADASPEAEAALGGGGDG